MTARRRLLALRRVMLSVLVARAALLGITAALAGVVIVHALALPASCSLLAYLVGVAIALVCVGRARPARSLERVALWVEERHPSLRYAVVTVAGDVVPAGVEEQALSLPWWEEARRRLVRTLVAPTIALLTVLALLAWYPALVRRAAMVAAAARGRGAARVADPLAALRATITPPRYTGRAPITAADPTSLDALVGSTISLSGDGDASRVHATIDAVSRAVASHGDRWSVTFVMPARPSLARLRSTTGRERLVVLAPVVDAPPAVTLLLPKRDTVVRAATGTLVLRAQLRDDIGLRDGVFELIVSSGEGESFAFRSTTLARTSLAGRGDAALEARLSLDSLALKPGDILQLRAVARDQNDVSGPGVGTSDTRAMRVARAGEYDSVSVDAAPSGDPEGQVLSQHMLITLTEALDRRRPRLTRPTVLDESRRIAQDQARLRKRVGDVVFQRVGGEPLAEESTVEAQPGKLTPEELLQRANEATGAGAGSVMDVEGDETPILAINKPLLEAFNAMWDAGRALEQGDTRQALPPMRRALAAIERARQAERIYLRGKPSTVVVDVAHARLTGKDKGTGTVREPRPRIDPAARRRGESFARATALLARDPSAAADTLLVMRVGALGDAPALAAALDAAAAAVRRGDARAVELAWTRVRRALGGPSVSRDTLPAWGGAP